MIEVLESEKENVLRVLRLLLAKFPEEAKQMAFQHAREKAKLEGKLEGKIEAARKLKALGLEVSVIAYATELSEAEVEAL